MPARDDGYGCMNMPPSNWNVMPMLACPRDATTTFARSAANSTAMPRPASLPRGLAAVAKPNITTDPSNEVFCREVPM
jgi:hypothetical protein